MSLISLFLSLSQELELFFAEESPILSLVRWLLELVVLEQEEHGLLQRVVRWDASDFFVDDLLGVRLEF